MPWLAIAEFVFKLFSGEVWAAWKKHKAQEAIANAPQTKSDWTDAANRGDL